MLLGYTICMEMYGNGVKITGMRIIEERLKMVVRGILKHGILFLEVRLDELCVLVRGSLLLIGVAALNDLVMMMNLS